MKTTKGPAIFLAQFACDAAPWNDLASISRRAGEQLGFARPASSVQSAVGPQPLCFAAAR